MTYDPTNRVTDPTMRKKDDTRTTDHPQILGNQEYEETQFAIDHSTTDGAHGDVSVTELDGYADHAALGVNPVPQSVGDVTLHLLHPTSFAVSVAFFQRADVGSSLTGTYEVQIAFGGDREWCAYAAIEKVA